jgi:CheY-like chemotaxis protein
MGRSGTGLGMTVVWGIVQDHRGHVHVESSEGIGTLMDLLFPATRELAAKQVGTIMLDEYLGRGETILVVDDMPEQRDLAGNMLRKLNYLVNTAPSGEDAVRHASAHPTDLLVLDMLMDPGIDGLETYLRILRVRPGQRAIIVSGFSETDRVMEARRLGATGYVRKPYTMETLGMAVREALDRNIGP